MAEQTLLEKHVTNVGPNTKNSEGKFSTVGSFQFSDFRDGQDRHLYALAARSAARLNAATVSQDEINSLLKERQVLLDKMFSGGMAKEEANRLEYVRWSLDRIADAQEGHVLDALERRIMEYEDLLDSTGDLKRQIEVAIKPRK